MNNLVKEAAGAYVAPKVLKAFRFRWLLFGAAAYYGLRFMSKRGIFPKQADAALNVIDNGIAAIKSQVGMSNEAPAPTVH